MRTYPVRTIIGLPVVAVVLVGPKSAQKLQLVFDSGAKNTQIHIGSARAVGYMFEDRYTDVKVQGVTGKDETGYSLSVPRFHVLGKHYTEQMFAAFDFTHWIEAGIDGLLGWDIISRLHLELEGPRERLNVY